MPRTTYGIGTREFGVRGVEPNGSYVTTKFFVVFHIPVWPIESRRVRRAREEDHIYVRRLPFCWPQVIRFLALGYGICLAIAALPLLGLMWAHVGWRTIASWITGFLR